MTKMTKPFIGIIGAGKCSKKMGSLAEEVGRAVARSGAILVCGGLDGVMAAAAKGAKSADGVTVGILPGNDKGDANEFIDYPIATGIGEARNLVIIKTSDAVIALPGKYGTLSEMAFCLKMGKPLISLSAWNISDDVEKFDDPNEAVRRALDLAEKHR
jgi:uncharacterized protein (TIGR00725 family)